MTALFWHFEPYNIPVVANLGNVKSSVEDEFRKRGFTDIRRTSGEVAGAKGGVLISVDFPPVDVNARRFYQVVVGAGNDFETVKATVNGIVQAIRNSTFL